MEYAFALAILTVYFATGLLCATLRGFFSLARRERAFMIVEGGYQIETKAIAPSSIAIAQR